MTSLHSSQGFPIQLRWCYLLLESTLLAVESGPPDWWFIYHSMRAKALLRVIGNHPASAGSAGEEPVQIKGKMLMVLLITLHRPLSKCYLLAYRHPMLCLLYADKTNDE